MLIDLPRLYHKWTLTNPNINIFTNKQDKFTAQIDGISVDECDVFIQKENRLAENDIVEIELMGCENVKGCVTAVVPILPADSPNNLLKPECKATIRLTDPNAYRLQHILGYVFSNGNISLMTQNDYWHLLKRLLKRLFM